MENNSSVKSESLEQMDNFINGEQLEKKHETVHKKMMKMDLDEPQKPVSAYALFFRDTQAAIKSQNPNASFNEVSKIVSSMWVGLDSESKSVYEQKALEAKKKYLKELSAYRATVGIKQIQRLHQCQQPPQPPSIKMEPQSDSSNNNHTANLAMFPESNSIIMNNVKGTVLCIREGCRNSAVSNSEWEDEYCSNECVVTHCRNVFTARFANIK